MKFRKVFWVALSLTLGTSAFIAPGCGDSDASDSADAPAHAEGLHFRRGLHHFVGTGGAMAVPSGTGGAVRGAGGAVVSGTGGIAGGAGGEVVVGGTGGAVGSRVVVSAECAVCTKANACCDAVGGGPLCTFSEATCSAYTGAARESYVRSCLNLIDTTLTANPGATACR